MSDSRIAIRNFGRTMTSEVFELVASDDVRFYVNKDILASQSKPFREATSGPWKEAVERSIDLKDWDSDTVARLVEYLYLRNYDYPDPAPLKSRPECAIGDPGPAGVQTEDAISVLDTKRPLTPINECLKGCLPPADVAPISDSASLASFDPADNDFQDILLAHAKVYSLANYKSVDGLQTLALRRLLLTLSRLHPLHPASHILMNIVELASYVYENTDCLSNSEEPLRKLTSQFIALNFAAFQTEPRAIELVAQGGDIVRDLMAKLSRRLPNPEGLPWAGDSSTNIYISGIKVVCGAYASPPADRVEEINGLDSNVSHIVQDPYTVWLVPEYTKIAKDACTKFVVASTFTNSVTQIHTPSDPRYPCYLDPVKDLSVFEKITEIGLYRTTDSTPVSAKSIGYDGMSGDIRNRSTANPLYLVWKSFKTHPL